MQESVRPGRGRIPAIVPAIVAVALACGGCSGGTGQTGSPGVPEPSAATSSAAPTDAPATPPTTQPQAAEFPECKAADLTLSTAEGGGAGMSHLGIALRFVNRSQHTCTLQGSPGVSFVGADGQQIGQPADRAPRANGKQVVLRPTAGADSQLVITNPGAYDPAECKVVQASGFRVYAPNDTAAMFLPSPQPACSAAGRTLLSVGVVGG